MSTPRPPSNYRQRLVQALAVVIARDGFNGAKIQDVVKEAKVSLRTFYAEFPNKEACFLELHAQITEAMVTNVSSAVVFDRPWRAVMRRGFEVYFAALVAEPRLTHAIVTEMATLSPHARLAREAAMDRFANQIADLVEQGRRQNPQIPSRELTPTMARGMLGAVTELVLSRVVRDEIALLPELVDTTTDMLWSIVTNIPADGASAEASTSGALANDPKSGVIEGGASSGAGVRR